MCAAMDEKKRERRRHYSRYMEMIAPSCEFFKASEIEE
jgi:hypothetical protein